jgi:DNA-directed RNA polymerase specialized sigma24 family protein
MPETLDAFNALDQVRRELIALNERVAAVDARVEQVRVAQMAALAVAVSHDTEVPAEMILASGGLTDEQIGQLLNKSRDAVRMTIARHRRRVKKRADG